jgi:hypothetical protein
VRLLVTSAESVARARPAASTLTANGVLNADVVPLTTAATRYWYDCPGLRPASSNDGVAEVPTCAKAPAVPAARSIT